MEAIEMTKYMARFSSGKEIVKTSKEFASRLDFMNWICANRFGKVYGKLIEVVCTVLPD